MSTTTQSRRTFLKTTAGLSMAAVLGPRGLATTATAAPVDASPGAPGPYCTGSVILGEDGVAAMHALPQYFTINGYPGFPSYMYADDKICPDGTLVGPQLPRTIKAAVYYPKYYTGGDYQPSKSNPLGMPLGRFPVLLYAHSYRDPLGTACGGNHPATRDFTGVETMLRHVASYGCVAVAPDLSWIPGGFATSTFDYFKYGILLRADILISYFKHLAVLNNSLFAGRLDLSRIVVAGHSTGGPAAVEAGRYLWSHAQAQYISYGLIAPLPSILYGAHDNLVVLNGTQDTQQGAMPLVAYAAGGQPKTLITIPGANHFGYTDVVPPENDAYDVGLYDENGGIRRDAQQLAGAAYLAALMRYHAQGDHTVAPYLSGEMRIPELADAGAPDIQIESQGYV